MNKRTVLRLVVITTLVLMSQTVFAQRKIPRICFVRGNYIFLREPNGRVRRLVKGRAPSLSPDGRTLAFQVIDRVQSHVKFLNIKTGRSFEVRPLKKFSNHQPTWSPDSRRIAIVVTRDYKNLIAVVDPFSRAVSFINPPDESFIWLNSWTADGKSLVLNDGADIFLMSLKGKVERRLNWRDFTESLIMASPARFSFSKNGKSLLFNSAMVPDDIGIAGVYVYDLESKLTRRLTTEPLGGINPQWLGTGKRIIFNGFSNGRNRPRTVIPIYDVYVTSLTAKKPRLLIRNAEDVTAAQP